MKPLMSYSLKQTFCSTLVMSAFAACALAADAPPAHLPGELSADEVLNGAYPYPPSPAVEAHEDATGLARERLSKVPAPGVHPRILLSPEDLPDLRKRLKETETGRALYATMERRIEKALRDPANWSCDLYSKLATADLDGAMALLKEHKGFPGDIGHYQPWLYAIVLEAFDSMILEDETRGRRAATALATYAAIVKPAVDNTFAAPLNDDVWRARATNPVTAYGAPDPGLRGGTGNHLLGYGYDFAYNFMTEAQRTAIRSLISEVTKGRVWMGVRLPHHFRNWNWIAVGMGEPLLALAIEGEEGYDPRVYKMGVEVLRDYLTYAISPTGMSTEAVGYTQFGFVWASPFAVAASRRGDNFLAQSHHRAMVDWYLHTLEPGMNHWTSHGDGGDTGPAIWTLSMWHYFYPQDSKADFLWQVYSNSPKAFDGTFHVIESLLWAADSIKTGDGKPVDYASGANLKLPLTMFDPVRSSLISRSAWNPDATMVEFECRTDSVGASHEHSDRGAFTLAAMGRSWAKDNFRSVETRHHNGILIDGAGEGYWPGPGRWLGLEEHGDKLVAACDAKEAYCWWWPKEITTESENFVRFDFSRWADYRAESREFRRIYGDQPLERDTRPSVVTHWTGFDKGDPRMWDEDTWPVRLPHNPVQRAFRTLAFSRGEKPYLLVVDDIQKDEKEHLYEWLMQTGMNTEAASISGNDIILCDASVKHDETGLAKPAKGDRELLVRVLEMSEPAKFHDYQTRPSFRLETFERKDTLAPEEKKGALSGARSFGLDKRLVIASRSVAPNFRILLFPLRDGDPLPVTTWDAGKTQLSVETAGKKETVDMKTDADGRTHVTFAAGGD